MDDDQQFCLRWNNHQSTLVSVFDNLLENGTLVDCTLFAEGKYLKAHKVVLSACSPYFEALLTQQYDKHPIFILKDVKFQELKAMMDYMYRGEVNISQDQLAALLKAAESLQIKGLSDSRSKESEQRKSAPPPPAKTPPPAPTPTLPRVQGLTIEQRKAPKLADTTIEDSRSREGSTSPVPRKRKKPRRRPSQEGVNDNHDASSSSESHSNQAPISNIPSLPAVPLASTSKLTVTDVPEPVEAKSEIVTRQKAAVVESPQVPIKEKLETHSELILEPKSEYIEEEMNEDSVEDLTLDDDDVSQMEQEMDHARPGPSHGSTDGSAQGFGGWHMSGNQNQDEVFLAAQEAVGAHRDSQDTSNFGPAIRVRSNLYETEEQNTKNTERKKRKRQSNRIWIKEQEFQSPEEAEKYVRAQKIWSKSSSKKSYEGHRVEYRCTQGKYRDEECPAAIYLLYHFDSTKVSLYNTDQRHDNHYKARVRGLDHKTKEFVKKVYDSGVTKPNAIIYFMMKNNMREPPKLKLNSYLKQLRRMKCGPPTM